LSCSRIRGSGKPTLGSENAFDVDMLGLQASDSRLQALQCIDEFLESTNQITIPRLEPFEVANSQKPESIRQLDEVTHFRSGGQRHSQKVHIVARGLASAALDDIGRYRYGTSTHLRLQPVAPLRPESRECVDRLRQRVHRRAQTPSVSEDPYSWVGTVA